MENPVFIIPVPVVLEGVIINIKTNKIYEVKLRETPHGYAISGGPSAGTISCSLIYSPGTKNNYNPGDIVKVLATAMFGGTDMSYHGIAHTHKNYIIGMADKHVMYNFQDESPLMREQGDFSYLNSANDAGIVAKKTGEVELVTASALRKVFKPFGHGHFENMEITYAQNYHRIISHNDPYLSREYFGLFKGKDQNDKMTKMSPKDTSICYKRFVQQTMDPGSWVSTCEGSWNPWVGPNNDIDTVSKGSEILYSKVIHAGTSAIGGTRLSIEAGDPGSSFYSFRLDKIIATEKFLPPTGGATPPVAGNLMKLLISDEGEIDFRAAGKAIPMPAPNMSGFNFKVSKDGDVILNAKGKIIISHGDTDASMCSIEFNGSGGINIIAKGGFKVNGQPVVSAPFIDFVMNSPTHLSMGPAPGTPITPNPAMIPMVLTRAKTPGTGDASTGGFTTIGLPSAVITGIQIDTDFHATSAS